MGQIIIDRNKKVWLRFGDGASDTINHYSAAVIWDDMLVLGTATTGRPNLVYADWDVDTEEAAIASNASVHGDILTKHRTKNYDLGIPDIEKQISRVAVIYRGASGAGTPTLTVKYRLDHGSWTTVSDSITSNEDDKTYVCAFPIQGEPAFHIQLQFDTTDVFEVTKLVFSYQVMAERKSISVR